MTTSYNIKFKTSDDNHALSSQERINKFLTSQTVKDFLFQLGGDEVCTAVQNFLLKNAAGLFITGGSSTGKSTLVNMLKCLEPEMIVLSNVWEYNVDSLKTYFQSKIMVLIQEVDDGEVLDEESKALFATFNQQESLMGKCIIVSNNDSYVSSFPGWETIQLVRQFQSNPVEQKTITIY